MGKYGIKIECKFGQEIGHTELCLSYFFLRNKRKLLFSTFVGSECV
jgi:hypothetical protein